MNGIKRCTVAIVSALGAGTLAVPANAAPPIYQRAAPAPKSMVRRHRKPTYNGAR
jgi:hypothetical protein